MRQIFTIIICTFLYASAIGQQVAKPEEGTFALTNATIHTVTNGVVEGTVLIRDGRITGVGDINVPDDATTIDCSGLSIYPGMIDAGTTLGLSEVGSISLTQDYNEVGDLTPHAKALTAVNPNSVLIPVTRVNGITTVLTKPRGGLFPGTASAIHLLGYTPDQMAAGYEAIILNFPSSGRRGRWDRRSEEEIKKAEEKALKRLKEVWEEAKVFAKIKADGGDSEVGYNPVMQALAPATTGDIPVHIEVGAKTDILNALRWAKKNNVDAVLTGVAEGWRVADSLAAYGYPVITGPVLSTPNRASDRYDVAYANAGKMAQAGVKVAIRTNETENVRNLPYNAGFAATSGMGKEEALKAVTIIPAEIMGLDDQIGSIEEGKVANLFVCDGDPFETKSQIRHLFISGWHVPLESRHTLLYDEFLERQPGLDK